ncbi:MAG: hypothetical protein QOD92_1608 [Acidimicrobiaceae bacterium]
MHRGRAPNWCDRLQQDGALSHDFGDAVVDRQLVVDRHRHVGQPLDEAIADGGVQTFEVVEVLEDGTNGNLGAFGDAWRGRA